MSLDPTRLEAAQRRDDARLIVQFGQNPDARRIAEQYLAEPLQNALNPLVPLENATDQLPITREWIDLVLTPYDELAQKLKQMGMLIGWKSEQAVIAFGSTVLETTIATRRQLSDLVELLTGQRMTP